MDFKEILVLALAFIGKAWVVGSLLALLALVLVSKRAPLALRLMWSVMIAAGIISLGFLKVTKMGLPNEGIAMFALGILMAGTFFRKPFWKTYDEPDYDEEEE